ncbi:MAG: esterase [Bacteroidales bacterium]|nr:esterase [Bacteroidales bacterium]
MKNKQIRFSIIIIVACSFCFPGLILTAQQRSASLISPEVKEDKSVIFRLYAPEAKKVTVRGTFQDPIANIEMARNDTGLFVATAGPLASDMYVYTFIVDGVRMLDPSNNVVVRDGSYIESRLLIPGDWAEKVIGVRDVPHGRVSAVWYPSPVLGMNRRMMVYTPPDYEKSNVRYPVLYLLHGAGGDEEAWISRGKANYIIDNLIADGKAVPMIIVITNGVASVPAAPGERPLQMAGVNVGSPMAMTSGKFEESLIKDVIPFIENNYRVQADPDHRAIAGLSMGGYQTQKITNTNPGKFMYIGVWSMGLYNMFGQYDKEEHIAQLKELKASNPILYYIGCGKTDFLFKGVTELRSLYDELGFKYTYRESEGGHSWNNWRLYLYEVAQMLFK